MLPGFNHNLRHKGLIFHIQTEDNGIANPYIITHVFYGGNIIVSRRQSYDKFAHVPERDEIVSSMMKEQHKEIMKQIVQGQLRGVQEILVKEGVPVSEPRPVRARDDFHAPANTPKPPNSVAPKVSEPQEPASSSTNGHAPHVPKVPESPGSGEGVRKPTMPPQKAEPKPATSPPTNPPVAPKVEKPAVRTLDTSNQVEKTLDELILDFLNDEKKRS